MPAAHTYELTNAQYGVYAKTLTAGQFDQINVDARGEDVRPFVEIWTDGTADVYFTVDGTDPVIGGGGSEYWIPAGMTVRDGVAMVSSTLKVISAGAVKYGVTVRGEG